MNISELKTAIKNIVTDLFPFLGNRTSLMFKARVVAVNSSTGTPNADGTGNRFFSVDLEPVTLEGEKDSTFSILKDVPVDVAWIGDNRGVYSLPKVGSFVRVGFYEGNPAYPYIAGYLSDGMAMNSTATGDLVLFQSATNYIRFHADGKIELNSDKDITVNSTAGTVKVNGNSVTVNDGTKGAARIDDPVDVQLLVTTGAFGAVTGVSVISAKVNGGSSTVKVG
jgi:Type VI secretion system/phage-baseplate injector OB domain